MNNIKNKTVDKQKRQWTLLLIFLELLAILLCFDAVVNCKEVQEDCNFIVGKVDEIYSRHRGGFIIYIGEEECRSHFPKRHLSSYIDDIKSEANVKILTTRNFHFPFFTSEESVVEIRSNSKVYYSIDQYNAYIKNQRSFEIIIALIFGASSSLGLFSVFGIFNKLKTKYKRRKKIYKKQKLRQKFNK